jgi:hypothetical protein
VRVDITVPGREIIVNRERAADICIALRDAFDAARRQLEDYSQLKQGENRSGRRQQKAVAR